MNLPSFVDITYVGPLSDIKRVQPHWQFTCDACGDVMGHLFYEAASGYANGHPCVQNLTAKGVRSLEEILEPYRLGRA